MWLGAHAPAYRWEAVWMFRLWSVVQTVRSSHVTHETTHRSVTAVSLTYQDCRRRLVVNSRRGQRFCVCVSVIQFISISTCPSFTKLSVHIDCGRGLVFWQCRYTLCTSSFADKFGYPRLGAVMPHVFESVGRMAEQPSVYGLFGGGDVAWQPSKARCLVACDSKPGLWMPWSKICHRWLPRCDRWTSVRMSVLRQAVRHVERPGRPPTPAHRRASVLLQGLRQTIRAVRTLDDPPAASLRRETASLSDLSHHVPDFQRTCDALATSCQ